MIDSIISFCHLDCKCGFQAKVFYTDRDGSLQIASNLLYFFICVSCSLTLPLKCMYPIRKIVCNTFLIKVFAFFKCIQIYIEGKIVGKVVGLMHSLPVGTPYLSIYDCKTKITLSAIILPPHNRTHSNCHSLPCNPHLRSPHCALCPSHHDRVQSCQPLCSPALECTTP